MKKIVLIIFFVLLISCSVSDIEAIDSKQIKIDYIDSIRVKKPGHGLPTTISKVCLDGHIFYLVFTGEGTSLTPHKKGWSGGEQPTKCDNSQTQGDGLNIQRSANGH